MRNGGDQASLGCESDNLREEESVRATNNGLNHIQTEQLQQLAKSLSIQPQALVTAAIDDLLSRPAEDFRQATHPILHKKEELYERLS